MRIMDHYRANPIDDGHPAYGFYKLAEAYTKRALADQSD